VRPLALFRYNPARESEGKSPWSSTANPFDQLRRVRRPREPLPLLRAKDPALADELMLRAEADVRRRWEYLQHLSRWNPGGPATGA